MQITPKEVVKSEIFYGYDLEEKQKIFKELLPNEEFNDRRLLNSNMVDPESDSEPGDYDFFEKYGEKGERLTQKPLYLGVTAKYPFTIDSAEVKIKPALAHTVDIGKVGMSTDWIRARLDMVRSLNSPANHSAHINQLITESEIQARTEKMVTTMGGQNTFTMERTMEADG